MLAIASLLDPVTDQQTRKMWQMLEEQCGLSGIKTAPYPHFSWIASGDIAWPSARRSLGAIARSQGPFRVRTAGFGIFSGPVPVLFLALVKSPDLMAAHIRIWKRMERYLVQPQEYYAPEQWMPHITIAHGDLNPEKLACAVQDLAFQPIAFDIAINNIALIYNTGEGVGIKIRYDLTARENE